MFFDMFLILILLFLLILVIKYRTLYKKEKFNKTSISVKHGKFLENYIPWIKNIFPGDPRKFRFLGNPIDGILFDDNEIVFMEFKTGKSSLSNKQKNIKKLVEKKSIRWKEIKIN
ncbi:hypothetical protein J7L48_06400 [bacterium]|nr:hypothetical protein [bacterium]